MGRGKEREQAVEQTRIITERIKSCSTPSPHPPTLILLQVPPSQVCQRGGCTEGRKSSTKSQAYPTHPEYKTHLTLDELTTHPVTRPHTRQGLHLRSSFLPILPYPYPPMSLTTVSFFWKRYPSKRLFYPETLAGQFPRSA